MQQQQQQQQQQRSSFYRANRPGNLNINVNDINDSAIQQQQQQQQQIQNSYNQQPLSASYSTQYNNQTNYSSTNLNSPHYPIQQSHIQQNPISPSYHSYTQNQYQNSNINYEQSFTPKYSPGPSSAHIANKQNYFNFDVPAKPTSNQIPQSPGPSINQNKYNQVPSSPHLSNQTKNLSISNNYNTQQTQNRNYQNYQFSNSYQKNPQTPASAIPYQSYNNIQSQHSISVPSSPIHPSYNQNLQNQHSVFQFNLNNTTTTTTTTTANNNNNNNTINNSINDNSINSSNNNNNNINNNFNNYFTPNTEVNRRVVSGGSFEFNPADNLDDLNPVNSQNPTDTTDNLIPVNTFGENDVDMVHEVINNMIQKEENIKLSPNAYMLPSSDTSSSSSSSVTASSNSSTTNVENSRNFNESFDLSFDTNQKDSNKLDNLLDLNNNNLTNETNKNTNNSQKANLDSLTSLANILLQNPQTNLSAENSNVTNTTTTTTNTTNTNKPFSMYSLSEAASAEFMLTYGTDNKLKPKLINKPEIEDKNKSFKKQAKIPSPQNYDESSYGLNMPSLNENKTKNVDLAIPQIGGSIQSCSDCGKIFTNKSALAKHKLIHSNERKYSCHLCDKSFKRQDHLNGHLLTHSDKKPFVCKAPGCDKSYCDSRSLKRHVESQHQDYLALLANGNQEALNYLPSIGKIKANLAPNFQHEISVQDLIVKTNKPDNKVNHHHNNHHNQHQNQQYSPITPVPGQNDESKISVNEANLNNPRAKNFFTFEEPKPETCKICGKGFKNIPALNGHMRLHGGFIKTKLGVKTTNELNNTDSNGTQQAQQQQPQQFQQPHSNSSILFNDDSMSSNCSSNNSFNSSSNLSTNTNKYHPFPPSLTQKPFQLPFATDPFIKQKSKGKVIHEKEATNLSSYHQNHQTNNLNQYQYNNNNKIGKTIKNSHDLNEHHFDHQIANSPPNTYLPNLNQSNNSSQMYNQRSFNYLEPSQTSENNLKNDLTLPFSNQNENLEKNDKNIENILTKQIYNITTALLNQQATFNTAAAVTAAAVATVVNASMNPNNQNISKPKQKPMPLIIPQDISAFQKTTNQKTNIPFYSQYSNGPYQMSHVYPHCTLLKSPRLFDYDNKKQYTPPPMLSPFRKGPGLFYNPKNLMFMMPNLLNNNNNMNKIPNFNHSMSYPYTYQPTSFNFGNVQSQNYENQEEEEEEEEEEEIQNEENIIDVNGYQKFEEKTNEKLENNDEILTKPSLMRSRLISQVSQTNTGQTGTFFPEESFSNEAIAASLIDDTANNTPYINIGNEFQADIPDLKEIVDIDYLNEPEDLMWSCDVMNKVDQFQLNNYLDLICKSSLVFGSSNNLELGLHILHYFNGDIKKSIQSFLDDTIELPANHPITTYKYSETDIWTANEIKKFESAILKHDKVFSEVSKEVETKSIKQCIEFYYLWKKVMSDSMKKKWKSLKKKRSIEENSIEQNLRSSSSSSNNNNNNNAKIEPCNDNESDEINLKNNENEFDDQSDELEIANVSSLSSKNYLRETQKNRLVVDENSKSRMSTPSPSQFLSNNRYECDKCNQVFKTKKKLGQHMESKH